MLEKEKLLELVEAIATHSDAEEVEMDVIQKRPVTKREKTMAKALTNIYKFVHGNSIRCVHHDWQVEARNLYSEFVKNNLF